MSWLSNEVLESLSRDFAEAKRLSIVEDNEDRPYESKYEARKILARIYEQVCFGSSLKNVTHLFWNVFHSFKYIYVISLDKLFKTKWVSNNHIILIKENFQYVWLLQSINKNLFCYKMLIRDQFSIQFWSSYRNINYLLKNHEKIVWTGIRIS